MADAGKVLITPKGKYNASTTYEYLDSVIYDAISDINKCDYVVISDIYVADELRGQKVATKLLTYLMEKYDRDIFAKCVVGTSAEEFWSHIGKQIDANPDLPDGHSLYEQRPGKRDLGWYVVENKNKKQNKVELF